MGLRSHIFRELIAPVFLLLILIIGAVMVLVSLGGCDERKTVNVTADAGHPQPVEHLADNALKTGRDLASIGQSISAQTQGIREDIKPSPAIEAAAGPKLGIIDTAVAALQVIANQQQTQTVAELRAVVTDLKAVVAERDQAITQFNAVTQKLADAEQREQQATERARRAEQREQDQFKKSLVAVATLGTVGAVGLLALAGWLAFNARGKEAVFVVLLAGALFGAAALLVWFAEHWREIAVGFGLIAALVVGYVVWVRAKLQSTEAAVDTFVHVIDDADVQALTLKDRVAERARAHGRADTVKDVVTAAKRRVRRVQARAVAAGQANG